MIEAIDVIDDSGTLQKVATTDVSIIVGANNSGKSLLLRDAWAMMNGQKGSQAFVKNIDAKALLKRTPQQIIESGSATVNNQGQLVFEYQQHAQFQETSVASTTIASYQANPQGNVHLAPSIVRALVGSGTLLLNGRTRFELTDDQPSTDLLKDQKTTLGRLYRSKDQKRKFVDAVYSALRFYPTFDISGLTKFRLRLARRSPESYEGRLDSDALEFMASALHIKSASDGVQALVGILLALHAGRTHTVLVDEPEAFLHPPLANWLGGEVGSTAVEEQKKMIIATHSADFLLGALRSGASISVTRLMRSEGGTKFHTLNSDELKEFLFDPLVRNTNALSGIFYDGVVVVEGDRDRVFYAEIFQRLHSVDNTLPNLTFVNATDKVTLKRIVGPLRAFGVPTAAIADLDLVKEGGNAFSEWLGILEVPDVKAAALKQMRASVKDAFSDASEINDKGLYAITDIRERSGVEDFLADLGKYGLFLVPVGELENWLSELQISVGKKNWTIEVLRSLGTDPDQSDYVLPSDDDVWKFVRLICDWIGKR